MDHKEIQSIWDAFQSVQEKKLSAKQKELDVDNDGDIEGDDLAALRNNKRKLKRGVTEKSVCPKCDGKGCDHCDDKGVHEEAPADPVKKAPARKGDKSNSDSSDLKGVKEDVEQVDEARSRKKMKIAGRDVVVVPVSGSRSEFYYEWKRKDGKKGYGEFDTDFDKSPMSLMAKEIKAQDKKDGTGSYGRHNESVEQVDELSNKKLASYVSKASSSAKSRMKKVGHESPWKAKDRKTDKRMDGIDRALRKMPGEQGRKVDRYSNIHIPQVSGKVKGTGKMSVLDKMKANRSKGSAKKYYGHLHRAFEQVKEDVEHIEEGPLSTRALDRKGQTFSHFRRAKSDKASKYLDKKQKDKNAEINKNDPKMAKFYGRSIVDTDKAVTKAGKKGLDKDKVKKGLTWRHRNSAQKSKLPEEVELRWAQSLAEMLSDVSEKKDEHTKGATESEKYDSKFSKGAKDFVAMHQKSDKEMEDKEQKGHDDVSKAGRATKAAAGRGAADQLKNGDKSVVKPVSGVVTKETK